MQASIHHARLLAKWQTLSHSTCLPQRTWKVIHHPANAILEHLDLEVDQQTYPATRRFQVTQQLSLVNRRQAISGLNLDNDRLFDESIEPITRIERNLSIDHRQGFLPFHPQAACGPFKSQTGLIRLVILLRFSRSVISALPAISAVNTYVSHLLTYCLGYAGGAGRRTNGE